MGARRFIVMSTAPEGLRRLDPKVRTLWHLGWALGLALVAAVVGLVVALTGPDRPLWVVVAAPTVLIVGVVAAIVVPRAAYARWGWSLTDDGLEIRHGVLLRTRSAIPTFRVQQVDLKQGPLERWLGLVTLRITTASSASDGALPGLATADAEVVRRDLLARLAADDGV